MSIAQSLIPEFDQEMASTRKVLERIPTEKWNWKPHEKSGTLGWLAAHVGTIPGWYTMTLQTENLDYAPVDGPQYEPPKILNAQQLLAAFDKESAEARAALSKASDADFTVNWTLLAGGKEIFTMPRICLSPQHGHESHDPPPSPTHRISAPAERADPRACTALPPTNPSRGAAYQTDSGPSALSPTPRYNRELEAATWKLQ
jgi:hypothetical protein